MKISRYAKTIVAGLLAAATAASTAIGDNMLSTTEAVTIALAVLTALGVYVVPNAEKENPLG